MFLRRPVNMGAGFFKSFCMKYFGVFYFPWLG